MASPPASVTRRARFLGAGAIAVDEGEAGALAREGECHRPPDARAASGDDRNLVGEAHQAASFGRLWSAASTASFRRSTIWSISGRVMM